MIKKSNNLENREEIIVNGVKVIKPIITYNGLTTRGDEESLIENRKRIIKKMSEVYQEIQNENNKKSNSI